MTYFYNAVCPVCQQPLDKSQDIVVCPECGAPYHRACYKQAGKCLYEDKHGTDFTYLPDPAPDAEPEAFVLCPRCGKGNPTDARACSNCGTPLYTRQPHQPDDEPDADAGQPDAQQDDTPLYRRKKEDVQKNAPDPETGKFAPPPGGFNFGPMTEDTMEDDDDGMENPLRRMVREMDLTEKLEGHTLAEWISFLGRNGPLYVFAFKQMGQRMGGMAMSFSALMLGPIYFAYRKMWLWAIVALLVRTVCGAPDMLLALQQQNLLGELALSTQLLQQLSLYGSYLTMAMNLFWGFAGYTLYRKHCIRSIDRLKKAHASENSKDNLYIYLGSHGGVSPVGAAVMVALIVLINFPLVWALM